MVILDRVSEHAFTVQLPSSRRKYVSRFLARLARAVIQERGSMAERDRVVTEVLVRELQVLAVEAPMTVDVLCAELARSPPQHLPGETRLALTAICRASMAARAIGPGVRELMQALLDGRVEHEWAQIIAAGLVDRVRRSSEEADAVVATGSLLQEIGVPWPEVAVRDAEITQWAEEFAATGREDAAEIVRSWHH
jgi:hypothetical protein